MFNKGKDMPETPEWSFDMENDLKDPAALRGSQEAVAGHIQSLKQLLRQGEDKQTFERTQTVLDGFLAVQKVINRINRH